MKELLRKAFEAGKDRQYAIEWQMGRKPDFEEWYKEHENEALSLGDVVGRSEQFYCVADKIGAAGDCKSQCESCENTGKKQ